MAFIIKTLKTIRNNWKKSTFAAVALSYGYGSAKEYFEIQGLMEDYCNIAHKHGLKPIPLARQPRQITVILNPNANKRKAVDDFDKYCAPILHLAGIAVHVIRTESEGHARQLVDQLESTEAIIVGGGDGTLSEIVTGLLRRTQENTNGLVPIGVLPLGRTNSYAKQLFPYGGRKVERVKALANAALAVVEEETKPLDILRVEVFDEKNENTEQKEELRPIYAVSGLKWGAYRDAEAKKDSYWVYGKFRDYATYVFNGYKSALTWNCNADLVLTPPCKGCSNCYRRHTNGELDKKWYKRFMRSPEPLNNSHIVNDDCAKKNCRNISTVELSLDVKSDNGEVPKLRVRLGPDFVGYFEFVRNGWNLHNSGERSDVKETFEARSVELRPKIVGNDRWFSIDNENYELKPVRVTLLPKIINIFCREKID